MNRNNLFLKFCNSKTVLTENCVKNSSLVYLTPFLFDLTIEMFYKLISQALSKLVDLICKEILSNLLFFFSDFNILYTQ